MMNCFLKIPAQGPISKGRQLIDSNFDLRLDLVDKRLYISRMMAGIDSDRIIVIWFAICHERLVMIVHMKEC